MKTFFWIIILLPSVLIGQVYTIDIDEAKSLASKEDKIILMVFSGSDWCKPCIKFKKDVANSAEFKSYADEHLVFLELDFPYSRKNKLPKLQIQHNETLAEKYNPKGVFPKLVLIDNEEKILGEVEYSKGLKPYDFVEILKSIKI